MRFELFKILDRQHVDDLLDGNLYMNSLQYFRSVENPAQGDPLEGTCGVIRKDQACQMNLHFDEDFLRSIHENITLLSIPYALNNLFCLYCLQISDKNKMIRKPSNALRTFDKKGAGQKVVVRIKDTEEFLRRLNTALQMAVEEHVIEYGIYGKVDYRGIWLNADGPGSQSAFHKEPRFEYQREWRLCILRHARGQEAFTLSIGDLRDITEEISLEDFLAHPETYFPGYQVVEDTPNHESETYRMFGSGNAVSRLMYAYMPQMSNKPILSDQAQADWHYTKFLDLSGRQGEIDAYLKSCLEKYKDLEHMELLANHRLSKGEWVEATDAFMFIRQNAPEAIRKEPERFFFQLHTILMTHHEAADAGKLLKIATRDYQLSEDLVRTMESDCLLALGFYDKAATVFEDTRATSNDPIVEYNLAVCYLYLLHFKKAQEHLNRYKAYYTDSLESVQKVRDIQKLLDCFISHKLFPNNSKEHALSDLAWSSTLEQALMNADIKEYYLGVEPLWQIETAGKWGLLRDDKSVVICPMTIFRIMELYQQTGDLIFYRIIERLRAQKNVTILSPDLNCYLEVDAATPRELLPHCKMEQALYIQNQHTKK